MNALIHTKKMFMDTYGEVPPMIGFLGVDTDRAAYNAVLHTITGETVKWEPSEQLPLYVEDARPIYEVNKEFFSWIPELNVHALTHMTRGAGQVRTNGRFAFTVNYADIYTKANRILDQVRNAHIRSNEKYELQSSDTEIHMVFSVCGGTGCGTFLNMAYLLRKLAPECKLTGYAVLPGVFIARSRSGMAKVAPNAYGALLDLDYLMEMGVGRTPFKLEYIKDSQDITDAPFNSVVFVDNKNDNNDTYTETDELAEMISLALITSAGELSSASASVTDNVEKNIQEGLMNIENKQAWASGMGICEIIYRNTEISRIYSLKAAKLLIERLFNSCEDADTIVNAWIDSPDVNIRENNNQDHVIEFIADAQPRYTMDTIDPARPDVAVDQYLRANQLKDEDIKARVEELTLRVKKELRNLLERTINKECGVATCFGILDGITAQINIFLNEMEEEKKDYLERSPAMKAAMDSAIADLKDIDGRFFKTRSKVEERENDVVDAAKRYCICLREIVRRDAAIQVFHALQHILIEQTDHLRVISDQLTALNKKLTTDIAMLQNNVEHAPHTFQIDLAQSLSTSLTVNTDEIIVAEFAQSLKNEGKIFGLDAFPGTEIEKMVLNYTDRLHTTKVQRSTTIDDVLDRLPENELDRIVRLAINKAMPIFRYDYRGYRPAEFPRDSFYVGVPDKKHNRLSENDYFKRRLTTQSDCDFSSIGVNDRVIVYHQVGVVPAYAIADIEDYRNEYEKCTVVSSHFDNNLYTRMQREEFSIQPHRQGDEDLLDLWVKGFIFGLVKNEDGVYKFQSIEHGDALDDNWVELGKYRDEAYDLFRTYKQSILKEFTDVLEEIAANKGADAMNAILAEARKDYLNQFSQINMTKEEIKKKGFERIRQLITDEINHAKSL